RNFSPTPADAVTYAPYMIGLGFLARLQPGSWRRFLLITIGIYVCLLYSVYCDPPFTMIPAISWSVAFAVVTVVPLCLRAVAVPGGAIVLCLAGFLISGVAVDLSPLSSIRREF